MPRARKPFSSGRTLIQMIWRGTLYAVPMALFFGTLNGGGLQVFIRSYWISLIFAYTTGIFYWAFRVLVVNRFPHFHDVTRRVWQIVTMYVAVGVAGAFAAAAVVHFTILPGFLGSSRNVIVLGMFALVFAGLGTGIGLAAAYYRKVIDRAKAEEELNLARRIQRSFLLSQFPDMPRLEVHAVNVSSRQVSGDFYDVVPAGDSIFLLAIADVAGKGVPAALLSSMLQASLRTQAGSVEGVSAILKNINTLVYRSTAVHQFATFFLARIEEDRLRMSYSNAGHNHPLVFRRGGERLALDRGGTVVGILESTAFEEDHLELRAGDRVVFYTDGISEAADARGEMFGEERLCRLMASLPEDLSARQATDRVMEEVHAFLDGTDPGDDMTLMVLRVLDSRAATTRDAAGDGSGSEGPTVRRRA